MKLGPYPFFEIYVASNPAGGSIVYWGLDRSFDGQGPLVFTLEWAETPEGSWEEVTRVTDTYFAVDPTPRMFAKEQASYYRLKLDYTTACGESSTATSYAQQSYGVWTKRDWLLAREISRKERLLQQRYVGWKGYLLKRKLWGVDCPTCSTWDTEDVGHGKCQTCYGTGKQGGYWPGHEVYGYQQSGGPEYMQTVDLNVGMKEDITVQLRMLAYPHINTYDVFVEEDAGRRFIVQKVGVAAEIKGIPLVYVAVMMQAPFTDIVYTVPIEPQEAVEEEAEEAVVPTATDEFLEPVTPDPVDAEEDTETEDEEEPIETEVELIIDASPQYGLWFDPDSLQWMIGQQLGDESTAVYSTTDGTANPYFVDSYSWDAEGVSVTASNDEVTVIAPLAAASGTYVRSGTYAGTFAYLQSE
jgi:hypothetical protein